jgi:moderate conductance mechanosensitive channel
VPTLPSWLLATSLRIAVIAIAAYVVIRAGSAATRRFEREMSTGTGLDVVERTKRAQTFARLLQRSLAVVVAVMAGLMILRELDIDITPVLTGAGIAGLAIGFGAQALIKDWLSGIFIVAENQFNAGEHVRIAGVEGVVEDFGLRRTMLRDADGTVHHVPNGQIIVASNLSRGHEAGSSAGEVAKDAGEAEGQSPESA